MHPLRKPEFRHSAFYRLSPLFILAVAQSGASCSDLPPDSDPDAGHTTSARQVELPLCASPALSAEEIAEIDRNLQSAEGSRDLVTIPVHWHVIQGLTDTVGGEVNEERIATSIDLLNDSFAGMISPHTAGTRFRFELASTSYNYNPEWFRASYYNNQTDAYDMKASLRVGGPDALNIYSNSPIDAGLLGWGTYPWDYQSNPILDGVVIHHRAVPGSGNPYPDYGQGDTLIHEVGHWLGLHHTFERGCDAPGDSISDTPSEAYEAYGCPVGRDTCPSAGLDPIHNFMNYSADTCRDRFTQGQAERMSRSWTSYRDPRCHSDAECRDGDPCNGEETCNAEGACVAGTAVECPRGWECEITLGPVDGDNWTCVAPSFCKAAYTSCVGDSECCSEICSDGTCRPSSGLDESMRGLD